jgi:hypothetical protein
LTQTLDMAKALFAYEVLHYPNSLFNIHQDKKYIVLMFKYDPEESDLLKRYESKCINLMEPYDCERVKKIARYFSRTPKPGASSLTILRLCNIY